MHIVSGAFKNRTIMCPKGPRVRPTSSKLRAAIFNMCQHIVEDCHFLDLFAGSGSMGLEAISRGAQSATFVDHHKDSILCIRKNIETLGLQEATTVIYSDVVVALKKLEKQEIKYRICYIDPPYSKPTDLEQSGATLDEALSILNKNSLVESGGSIFVEDAPKSIIDSRTYPQLKLIDRRSFGDSVLRHFIFEG